MRINSIPITNTRGLVRDTSTHAIINTNTDEYNSYLLKKSLLAKSKQEATDRDNLITSMQVEINELKRIVSQLLDKDLNVTITPK